LVLLVSGRLDSGSSTLDFTLNNDSTSTYGRVFLSGNGSSVSTNAGTGTDGAFRINSSSTTANTFGNVKMYISNYTSTNDISISIDSVSENNATAADQEIRAHNYQGGLAITSIELFKPSANLVEHSTASLYKITDA